MIRTNISVFEEKIGKTVFVVETKNQDKGKETAEEKLRNIMIKELFDKHHAMIS